MQPRVMPRRASPFDAALGRGEVYLLRTVTTSNLLPLASLGGRSLIADLGVFVSSGVLFLVLA